MVELRRLLATTNASVTVKLPSALDRLPAWQALFGLFDTIARQASSGELAIGDVAPAPLLDRTSPRDAV